MKKNVIIVLALFAAFVVGTFGKGLIQKMYSSKTENEKKVDWKSLDFLSEVASKANKILPVMVDSVTEHKSVIPQYGEIIHQYRLIKNVKSDFDLNEFKKSISSLALNFLCSTSNQRQLLSYGVSITNKYYDKNMIFIDGTTVKYDDCKNISEK